MVDTTEFNLVPNNEEEEFTVDFGEVTRLAGSSDFNQLQNRPQYDGQVMTGETDIPKVPTATSELNNDSDYQTGSEVQQTINAAIANKQDKLTAGQNITISEQNVISATGLTEVDWGDIGGNLNDQIDLKDVLDAKQDTLTPGDNVTIANNIISATDTKYTAGNGLSLNGTQFSADTAVLQEKLDAGNAITIENNTINADIYPADFFTNEATDTDTGSNITLDKTIPATLKSVELYGDTEQQAYSGKNLIPNAPAATLVAAGITWTITETTISGSGTITGSPSSFYQQQTFASDLPAGTYTFSIPASLNYAVKIDFRDLNNVNHSVGTIAIGSTSVTFTTNYVAHAYVISLTQLTTGDTFNYSFANQFQLEAGSTATAYEPYVGGIPAPNPDYPQDIHVVTGEQTVTVTGKNLFSGYTKGINLNPINGSQTTSSVAACSDYIPLDLTGTNTFTISGLPTTLFNLVAAYNANKVFLGRTGAGGFAERTLSSNSFTGGKPQGSGDIAYIRVPIYENASVPGVISDIDNAKIQLEEGSSATTYQPYQSESYTVNLGTTELCKIGDYQDYIYKSGDDWYVHKEVNKHTFTGSENWYLQTSGTPSILYCGSGVLSDAVNSAVKTSIYSDHFYFTTGSGTGGCYLYNRSVFVFYGDTTTTAATFKTWLGNNNTAVYYPLATPTDTKITDAGLIADLNALAGAKSYLDVTNFTVTATGTNLPALLKPEVYVKSLHSIIELLNSYK